MVLASCQSEREGIGTLAGCNLRLTSYLMKRMGGKRVLARIICYQVPRTRDGDASGGVSGYASTLRANMSRHWLLSTLCSTRNDSSSGFTGKKAGRPNPLPTGDDFNPSFDGCREITLPLNNSHHRDRRALPFENLSSYPMARERSDWLRPRYPANGALKRRKKVVQPGGSRKWRISVELARPRPTYHVQQSVTRLRALCRAGNPQQVAAA